MEKPILITSASLDEHAYGPVREHLEKAGYPTVVYRTDKVLVGEESFLVDVTDNGELMVKYNNLDISPANIGAAWYRKLGNFFQDIPNDRAKQLYLNNEFSHLHDTVWPLYPQETWLNSPDSIRKADRKLLQLIVARELGFTIPETIISSDWSDISTRLLPDADSQMIVKTVRGIISDREKLKALYTTVLDAETVERMTSSGGISPFPGLYQPFLGKRKEWRVTMVGDEAFSAAIYTDNDAKDDWRRLQATSSVTFRQEQLSDDIAEKCVNYLGAMGLKFGAFDFVETYEGEIVFLECNPNGQYGWLEQSLDLPISSRIADELIKIAEAS